MRIAEIVLQEDGVLSLVAEDGRRGFFDVRPYMDSPAFQPLKNPVEFAQVTNGGYFIEWRCGADLSADTIEAKWQIAGTVGARQ